MEALDPFHQCLEYWDNKQSLAKHNHGSDSAEPRAGLIHVTRSKEDAQEQEPPLRALQAREPQPRIVNTTTNSRMPVNICSTNKSSLQAFTGRSENPAGMQGIIWPSSSPVIERLDTYSTMQGLFQRATPAELRVLYRLFTTEAHGAEWGSAFRALTEEVQKKFL